MMIQTESMTVIRRVMADEGREWDEFVSRMDNGHLFQSWGWGELKRRSGWRPVRLAAVRDGQIVAGAQVLIRSRFGLSLAYVPRGPVVPSTAPDLYARLLNSIHKVAHQYHSIFLKVEPNEPRGSEVELRLLVQGFVRSPQTMQPTTTLVVDLEGGPDAVLSRMSSKTRWYVRQSEKRGACPRPAYSDSDIEAFHRLMVETGQRASFPIRSASYFRQILDEFRPRGQAELLLAEYDGRVIAGVLVFAYGREGIYLYAASSSEYRDKLAGYLLMWHSMQWCMSRGCTRYDLWGVLKEAASSKAVPSEQPSSLWRVYRFKRHFSKEIVQYIPAYDYPYVQPIYLFLAHRLRGARANSPETS